LSVSACPLCAKSGHFAWQPTASFDHLVSAARFGGPSSVSHCRGSGGLILIAAWLALAVAAIAIPARLISRLLFRRYEQFVRLIEAA
jgi:hypothetical protein